MLAQAPSILPGVKFRPVPFDRPDPFSALDRTATRFPYLGMDAGDVFGGRFKYYSTTITWDTTYHELVGRYTLNAKPFGQPIRMPVESYKYQRIQSDNERMFRETVFNSLAGQQVVSKDAIEIQVPLKVKSKTFQRIFGGDRVGLRVNGELSINGSVSKEANDRVITQQGQAPSTNFQINQTQKFTITGNVGDKVTVRIDQDSERLFEFENAVKLEYTGNEDEIVQKIEAGNISLELPGAQLATFSGQNKGLFGLKSIAKIGGLKLTTIASLEKGKKNKLKKSGGEDVKSVYLQENNFIHSQHFVLDGTFRNMLNKFTETMDPFVLDTHRVVEYYVYQAGNLPPNSITRHGYAVAYNGLIPADTLLTNNNVFVGDYKLLLEGSDYELDKSRGILSLKRALDPGSILGIAYRTFGNGLNGEIYGTLQSSSQHFVIKLLRGNNEDPQSAVWNLMLRNWYSLQGTDISRSSFEAMMYRYNTNPRQELAPNNQFWSTVFGIDLYGPNNSPIPDGKLDTNTTLIDFNNGILKFPSLTPFDVASTFYRGSEEIRIDTNVVSASLCSPELYTSPSTAGSSPKFQIEVKLRSRSNVLALGIAILEGSEEVTLNGRQLQKGIGYSIDYFSGTLTLLDPAAMAPGADLEVTYESGQIFQLDRKTLLGVRAEYELWDESLIGATFLSLDEKPLDTRIRLGSEPISNKIWDINARFVFKPTILTKAMDALPLVSTEEPSSIRIEGEVAQVFPNPNNMSNDATGDYNGVAYVDDFESAKRTTTLPLSRQSWALSAFPQTDHLNLPGDTLGAFPTKSFQWYNPYHQEPVKNIWPNRDVNSNVSNTVQTLELKMDPRFDRSQPTDTLLSPRNSWGAITKYLGAGYANQQQSKYIELWVRNTDRRGTLFLDFGRISEQMIPMVDRTITMTEDRPIGGSSIGNGILDNDEDIGIDQMAGPDPNFRSVGDTVGDFWDLNRNGARDITEITLQGSSRTVREPYSLDDFNYNASSPDDYSHINGTENNQNDNHHPDTEAMDSRQITTRNDFYRFKVDLTDDNSRYIVGGRDNRYGWRLFRIPLSDTLRVNNPDLLSVYYFRIGLTNCDRPTTLSFAEINIVGNEWNAPGNIATARPSFNLEADVVNTYDNGDSTSSSYVPPPGVSGQVDPITNIKQKEQALRIKVKQLATGETSYLVKTLYERLNFREYRQLKMFVYGGAFPTPVTGGNGLNQFDQYKLYFKLRLGVDSTQGYYEIAKRIYPGWDPRNNITVNLDDLPTMKYAWMSLPVSAQPRTTLPMQSRILPDGTELRVIGTPSLRPFLNSISMLAIAVENRGKAISPTDNVEIWADELRVTDVKRTPGTAFRVSTDIDMAKIVRLTVGMTQTDGNFHNVNTRVGQNSSAITGNASMGIKADEFLPKSLGITMPITINATHSVNRPDYLENGDISLDRLTGKSETIWKPFWRYIFNNDLLKPQMRRMNPDTLLTLSKAFSISATNITRTSPADKWWEKWFVNRWSTGYSHSETYGANPTTPYSKSRSRSGSLGFSLPIESGTGLKPLLWTENIPVLKKLKDTEIGYIPTDLSARLDGTEQTSKSLTSGILPTNTWSFTTTRRFASGYKLFQNMKFDYSLSLAADAEANPQLRRQVGYAAMGYDLPARWFSDTVSIPPDSLRRLIDSASNGTIPANMYQKVGGYYFRTKQRDQTLSTTWNPALFEWLSTGYQFNTTYSWAWQQPTATGRNVSSRTSANQQYTLQLQKLFGRGGGGFTGAATPAVPPPQPSTPATPPGNIFERPGSGKGDDNGGGKSGEGEFGEETPKSAAPDSLKIATPPEPARRGRPTKLTATDTSGSAPPSPEGVAKKRSPLDPFWAIIDRMDDINVQINRSREYAVFGVGQGQADWRYQLGLESDPQIEKIIPRSGMVMLPSARLSREYATTSGFKLSDNIKVDFNHAWKKAESITTTPSATLQKTGFLVEQGDDMPKVYDIPNFKLTWTGIEKLGPWSEYAKSISLDNGYQAATTTSIVSTLLSRNTIGSVAYEKSWTPLARVTVNWKNGISTAANYSSSTKISDSRIGSLARQRTSTTGIGLTSNYSLEKGFRIPIKMWPFNGKHFKNKTDISLTYNKSTSKNESNNYVGNHWGGFYETSVEDSYTLTPKVSVQFSNSVTGYVQYELGERSTTSGGKTRINSLKFNVNIQIRG